MKNFYIADLHLFHENILRLSNRPFSTLTKMHETIIENWNKKVTKDDNVYILGDVSLGHTQEVIKILKQLNGRKILIIGNHDHKCLKNKEFRNEFIEITSYKELEDNNKKVILFHYPIEEWNGYFRNSIHLYGHVHINDMNLKPLKNRYNVGIDKLNFEPCSLDEIITINSD